MHSYHGLCELSIARLLQVFDGHGGTDAALFIRENILRFIVEDIDFPFCVEKAIKSAFLNADHAFADDSSLDSSSGTTALTALIFGRYELCMLTVLPNIWNCSWKVLLSNFLF